MACSSCHQGHYPRLNALVRDFRDAGYQLPDGAVVAGSAGGGSVVRNPPLSFRGQVFAPAPVASGPEVSAVQTSLGAYVMGGGTLTEDVSYFFSWTPFPEPTLHQARVGVHDLWAERLGEGTLNVRAGALFLLDFARPSHRHQFPAPAAATSATVGRNGFAVDDANLGAQLYGRPGLGPLHYAIAVVAGDMGGGVERDDWKDLFARSSYTLFHRTDHELTVGAFTYLGRSELQTDTQDFVLRHHEDAGMHAVAVHEGLGRMRTAIEGLEAAHEMHQDVADCHTDGAHHVGEMHAELDAAAAHHLDVRGVAHCEEMDDHDDGGH